MKAEDVKKQVMNHYSDLKGGSSLEEKYPELDSIDGKTHVLFVQCLLERNSFYRTYLPYLILNNTESHIAIIGSIQKRDFTKSFQDYDVFLQKDLIEWADFIVFPALLFDCRKMFGAILKVNPKIKFTMDLDQVYSENENSISPHLLNNIRFTHQLLCSSVDLAKMYKAAFSNVFNGIEKTFLTLPTFLVSTYLKKRSDDPLENFTSIRIGLIHGSFNSATLDVISKVSIELKTSVTLCIYGNSKQAIESTDHYRVERFKAVQFLDYFSTIKSMEVDFMLIEGVNKVVKTTRAIFQYGELALLSIPLVIDEKNKGRRFVKHGINGFVITDENSLECQLKALFKNIQLAHKAGKAAQGMALKHLSWNSKRASQLIHIYQKKSSV